MPNQIDNIIIQVRSKLQERSIKLWLEPYYFEGVGSVESELDNLANEFSGSLGISVSNCKIALSELQDGALRKLEARREFSSSGIATFVFRSVHSVGGTQTVSEVKCAINALGSDLMKAIAQKLNVANYDQIKVISAGKIVNPHRVLSEQGLINNQQLMVIVSDTDPIGNEKEAMYDRVRKVKSDVEKIVKSRSQTLFEMEDQDGNAVHLPPHENRAILMALAFYEKGRVAMKTERFDEALILFLESDDQFSACNSSILQTVDNYALLNLDIVWCYLCLKNVTQLPDAERRLNICEQNFKRSYGEDLQRLLNLKGRAGNERALIMRLYLLQGVVYYHQNRRNEAHEKLSLAEDELRDLKIDEQKLKQLVDMGYETIEARISLRACNNDIIESINFIEERREKRVAAREKSKRERELNKKLPQFESGEWINPRSLQTLIDMGFGKSLATAALKKTKNDVMLAVEILQSNQASLLTQLPKCPSIDQNIADELIRIGFTPEMVKLSLENTNNNLENAIEMLLKMQNETGFLKMIEMLQNVDSASSLNDGAGPSSFNPGPASTTTSGMANAREIAKKVKRTLAREIESMKAYHRFSEGVSNEEDDYLNVSLVQEEAVIIEYKGFLEQ